MYLSYLIKIFGLSAQFIIIFIRIQLWSNIIPKLIIQVSIHDAKIQEEELASGKVIEASRTWSPF